MKEITYMILFNILEPIRIFFIHIVNLFRYMVRI